MIWNIAIILVIGFQPTTKPADDLRDRCDALLQDVVKRPYGWAWAADGAEDAKASKRRDVIIAMDRGESASAGLVLLWAGRALGDRSYIDASREVARAVAASQQPSGMILSRPTFATNAGGREPQQYVPSRSATIAGLALLLAELDEPLDDADIEPPLVGAQRERLRSAAIRAATWLTRQQGHNGAWVVGFPPDAMASDAIRLQRLDDPICFRDSTFALLMASDVVGVHTFHDRAKRAVDLLMTFRLSRPVNSADLWGTAYTMDGLLSGDRNNFPDGADLIASRFAIQTLLAMYLATGEVSYAEAIKRAGQSITALRGDDGTWERFPNPGAPPRATTQPTSQPTSKPTKPQPTTRRAVDVPEVRAEMGMPAVLIAITRMANVDRNVQIQQMRGRTSLHRQLLASMAGLDDNVLLGDSLPEPAANDDAGARIDPTRERVQSAWRSLLAF